MWKTFLVQYIEKLGNYKSNNIKTQLNTVFLSKILKFYSKNAGEKQQKLKL